MMSHALDIESNGEFALRLKVCGREGYNTMYVQMYNITLICGNPSVQIVHLAMWESGIFFASSVNNEILC